MATKLNQFTESTTINDNDYFVGYTNTNPGGERRWTAKSLVTGSITLNGYIKLPGGLIIQWGRSGNVGVDRSIAVTFPIAFPTQQFTIVATTISGGEGWAQIYGNTNTGFTVARQRNAIGTTGSGPIGWMAIGY
jgi:hypothetical protein